MTIQIGEKKLAISRAGDFEARLIETTGCNAAEHASMLAGYATPYQVARALHPMLVDPMPIGDLSVAIQDGDANTIREDVIALLTATPEPTKKGKGDAEA
jgi:hypothetical protein